MRVESEIGLTFFLPTRSSMGGMTKRREEIVRTTKFDRTNRGAKGTLVIKRGYFAEVFPEPVVWSMVREDG